jgi:DNA polymerase eta
MVSNRAIIHLDLDCFYCQVEQVRLGILNEPLCVQQWNGILSVNYIARELGISRKWTAQDIKEKLPQVHLAHVPVLQMGETKPRYVPQSDIHNQKASLSTYRHASIEIMKLIQSLCPKFQKASIDEAYMDVTDQVNEIIKERGWDDNTHLQWPEDTFHALNPVRSSMGMDDARLLIAAEISSKVRACIYEKLGYTASTGIACNKTLAKLISALNKPNKQTVLRNADILDYMKTIPFAKIKGLGGKFGKEVDAHFSVEMSSDLWKFSLKELQSRFGPESGQWLYDISRGICTSEVSKTQLAKSIQSMKSFGKKLISIAQLQQWLYTMCAEVLDRAQEDFSETGRWPKNLTLSFSVGIVIVKQFKFPHRESIQGHETIFEMVWKAVEPEPKKLPVGHIALALTSLENATKVSIMRWLKPKTVHNQKALEQLPKLNEDQNTKDTSHKEEVELLCQTLDENGEALFFKCIECGDIISVDAKMEHQDYHLALTLSRTFETNSESRPSKREHEQPKDFFRKRKASKKNI